MRIKLKIAVSRPKRGTGVYYYAWRGGPRIQTAAKPGTPEFMQAYNEAIGSVKPKVEGSIAELVALFKSSTEYTTAISERTRLDYARLLRIIEDKFGKMPIAALESRQVRGVFKQWRDRLATKSLRQADYAWTVLQRVFSVAKDRGRIAVNPCEKGGRLYEADRTERVWSEEQIAAFLNSAPAHLHLPLMLALWTGQRQGDLLRLPWSAYDGTHIQLRQRKGKRNKGTRVRIPVGDLPKAMLDATRRLSPIILINSQGGVWTPGGFGASWRKACRKAGIPVGENAENGVTFHDLRGTAVTRLALAGCTVPEIAAITGHSLRDVEVIVQTHYLGGIHELAENAMFKLQRSIAKTKK